MLSKVCILSRLTGRRRATDGALRGSRSPPWRRPAADTSSMIGRESEIPQHCGSRTPKEALEKIAGAPGKKPRQADYVSFSIKEDGRRTGERGTVGTKLDEQSRDEC
ncbi:hypothetical protein R1flu_017871 [Riccia fluitans]|uniref:Uncharacterized protein n=1 Tax=Riccia fluitans TaxID=41844 RepID=A0ABD1ZEG7_9MARC